MSSTFKLLFQVRPKDGLVMTEGVPNTRRSVGMCVRYRFLNTMIEKLVIIE